MSLPLDYGQNFRLDNGVPVPCPRTVRATFTNPTQLMQKACGYYPFCTAWVEEPEYDPETQDLHWHYVYDDHVTAIDDNGYQLTDERAIVRDYYVTDKEIYNEDE